MQRLASLVHSVVVDSMQIHGTRGREKRLNGRAWNIRSSSYV